MNQFKGERFNGEGNRGNRIIKVKILKKELTPYESMEYQVTVAFDLYFSGQCTQDYVRKMHMKKIGRKYILREFLESQVEISDTCIQHSI